MIWTLQDVLDAPHRLATDNLDLDERARLEEVVDLAPELIAVAADHARRQQNAGRTP
jgi:hypothetical protein